MKIKRLFLVVALFYAVFTLSFSQITRAPLKLVDFVLTPDHDDWNYHVNEDAVIKVQVLKFGVPIKDAAIEYEFGPEMMDPEKVNMTRWKEGMGEINIGSLANPGFKQLKVKIHYDGKDYRDMIKVAFDPEKIMPTVNLPDDFYMFWQQAQEQNALVPMDPVVTHKPEYSTSTVDVFLVSLQNYRKNKRIFGYLSVPKKEGSFPVIMNPPGAGVKKIYPNTYYSDMGFIYFTIEIHGISPEISSDDYKNISRAFGDYWLDKLDDKDNYYYKSVYLGCVRAIDFLVSLPEFDGRNIIVKGGSQGGALSIVTAGLDKRVTALAAFYPALCDETGYLNNRAGGWPHMFHPTYQEINATPEKVNTMAYYDVVNFARNITVSGFYSFGYNDNTCPPSSVLSALNVISAAKEIVITPISGHWRFGESDEKSNEWIKLKCGVGE